MTSALLPVLAVVACLGASAVVAQSDVVVELFSSQGCSACPPADALLQDLARMEGVIALSLHVDYWDYIGWADSFASPAHTARQERYAMAAGERTIYTPQFIVGGSHAVVGADAMQVMSLIRDQAARADTVTLQVERRDGVLVIRGTRRSGSETLVVQLVRYVPEETVEILGGENAGQRLVYANIVTDWQVLGLWEGTAALALTVPDAGPGPAVVLVQEEGPGPIHAAMRLD